MKMIEKFVYNNADHLRLFKNKAWEYKDDWNYISKRLSTTEILPFMISKYKLVDGEQIIRPIHFYKVGGDCDNQLVFLLAYFYFEYGRQVERDLHFVTVDFHNGMSHIFLEYKDDSETISFDALPLKYNYTEKDIDKINRVSLIEI